MKATLDELQLGNKSHDKDLPQTLLKERVPHFPCFIGLLITYVSFIAFLVYEQKKKGFFLVFLFFNYKLSLVLPKLEPMEDNLKIKK